jgi:hypothetical protein
VTFSLDGDCRYFKSKFKKNFGFYFQFDPRKWKFSHKKNPVKTSFDKLLAGVPNLELLCIGKNYIGNQTIKI